MENNFPVTELRTMTDHVFELARNSINAGSENIHIIVEEDIPMNLFKIEIIDDGLGIKPQHISDVKGTFFTTRSQNKRKVGLGLSLMEGTCQRCEGSLTVDSEYRHGTKIMATLRYDHVDRPPLGEISSMFTSLMMSSTENKVLWTLEHIINGKGYRLRNRLTLEELNHFSFAEPGIKGKLFQLIEMKERLIMSDGPDDNEKN
jgi:anti-sigma regulatory factor (Ser/Thr protein kinase)